MAKTYDKEKWLEDSKVRVEKAKHALEQGLAALQSSDDWIRTLKAMAALGPARLNRLYAEHRIMPSSRRRTQFPEGTGALQLQSSRH